MSEFTADQIFLSVRLHEILSKRELEVAGLIADGQPPEAISKKLALSVKTVSTYRARVMDKLKPHGVESNARLAVLLFQAGLTPAVKLQ